MWPSSGVDGGSNGHLVLQGGMRVLPDAEEMDLPADILAPVVVTDMCLGNDCVTSLM